MIYMESTSAYDGTYNLTVSFDIGSDPNMDQVLVQNRVQNAMAQLPQSVQTQGVSIRAKASSILEFVTLEFAGQVARRACSCGITRRSISSTSWRGFPGSATSRSWARANIRCGSGWTRTSSIRSGWCRRM